jgi:TonB family protein
MSVLDLLAGLARANLAAAAAVVVVMLLRKPARRAFGARAAYLLWMTPALAGAAALVPPASMPAPLAPAMMMDAVVVAGGAVEAAATSAPVLPGVMLGLWIAGAACAAAVLLWRQARFMGAIRRREAGPAVVGALRPRIVTPADFEARFSPDEREVILAHEAAHLTAGDARINALAALLLCACWFNPLVHVAVYLMRLDQELACDAAVLSALPQGAPALCRGAAEDPTGGAAPAVRLPLAGRGRTPAEGEDRHVEVPLPAPARRMAGVAAVALLSGVSAAAAWAAQPGQPNPGALAKIAVAAAPATVATPATAATGGQTAAAAAVPSETANTLTQAEANAQAGPNDEVLCKPGTDWRQKNCRIVHGRTFAAIATAADIAREWPATARQAGISAVVMLECTPNMATRSLESCQAIRITPTDGSQTSTAMNSAFEQAAIRVRGQVPAGLDAAWRSGAAEAILHDRGLLRASDTGRGPPAAPVTGPGPHGPVLAVLPDWVARPDGIDIAREYPPAAAAAKQEGRAVITCRVDGEGRLNTCQLINEAPLGAGFGDAALRLAGQFQMKPIDKNGQPTAGQDVRIPFKFLLSSGDAVAAPAKVSDANDLRARLQLAQSYGVRISGRPDFWPPRLARVMWADPPPAAAPAEVVVSRREANVVAAAQDVPMVLVKAGRREDAVVRRVVFAAIQVTRVRPAGETTAARDVYRWTHQGFVQRTLCAASITGQFLCAAPQSEAVGDGEAGSAPFDPAAPEASAAADTAAERLVVRLRAQAMGLFETDRKTRLEPMLKAAGVTVAPAAPAVKRQR